MLQTEVAIVGAGPAGLAAAIEAAKLGVSVTVLDENQAPGGQLFKQIHKFFGSHEHKAGTRGFVIARELLEETGKLGVQVMLNTAVWGIFPEKRLACVQGSKSFEVQAHRVILATGASENALSFCGSTLPGVMGAGAAQTFINIHRVMPGRRFLMVGSGNVGLIVAYQILQAGGEVIALVEGASEIGGYVVHAAKLRRAGVPIYTRHTILRAEGDGKVERAVIAELDANWNIITGTEKILDVDTICIAVGLTPLGELAWMAGCQFGYFPRLGGHVPLHDANMETTMPGIFVAGDIAGVEEASTAMEEGRLAGVAVAESLGRLKVEEARQKKDEIWRRLCALRTGPFGRARQDTKEEILRLRGVSA
ncbi:MAG: FAD-dependent oxidoreductase [Firmicutes bacterium]|nr:FAD-dependent oxidoreductase [Bacillota bacterium]